MAQRSIWDIDDYDNLSEKNQNCHMENIVFQNYPMNLSPIEFLTDIKLNKRLQAGMDYLSFYVPNAVQKYMLPLFLYDRKNSVVLVAPKEYGKTTTALIVALEEVSHSKRKMSPRVVMLCSSSELAKKAHETALGLTKYNADISIRLLNKSKDIKKKITDDVVIGTPEKVYEAHNGYESLDLQKVETLIMDEANSLVPMVINPCNDVTRICRQLRPPNHCRLILFSSTNTKNLSHFTDRYLPCPTIVEFPSVQQNVRQIFLKCSNMDQKIKAMFAFVTHCKYPGQSVVICDKRETAENIVKMCKEDLPVTLLAGNKKGAQRSEIIRNFNDGGIETLVTTPAFVKEISKRGVSTVFNFNQLLNSDMTLDQETYSERTNVIGRQGIVVNVIDKEWATALLPSGTHDKSGHEIMSYEDMFSQ